ncbi:hypothetical protein A4H97_02860 [Niastella yeongjuensis]|uniref:Uncharacterized protein n=1 Tax=Niastella yeongjuensis TaxID=354355 RepID=A0A1V9EXD9_9BACT|nr:hypothetical protein [Niastella yeongjuensis]OQP50789.1 hypothetical protein A4H97_02860 [Niastella yeongjuensis]SEN17772.1 hypothetical protein SAMN05660816_00372 [Niastella yeongjuensis]
MRQQHSSISKSDNVSSNETTRISFQPIMADSLEVMEYYYRGKIWEVELSLAQLNILDNAREIAGLCKEIVRIKEVLQMILTKKEGGSSINFSIK